MAQQKVRNPLFARVYARLCPAMERGGMAERRQALLADLAGTVVEVGAGSGATFAHYPPAVTRVVAVEPEPYLRAQATHAAAEAPVPVKVVDGTAERLPAGDGVFDGAVVALVLCSVADVDGALAELRRVLRPGGQLRFLEHVRAEHGYVLPWVQRALDATIWPRIGGGCHTCRDTTGALTRAGFTIHRLERFRYPEGPLVLPTSPHVSGAATRAPGDVA
ncbi:MAG: class I SAM-dependent methyltransferase [Egibacteraceae bacterium]